MTGVYSRSNKLATAGWVTLPLWIFNPCCKDLFAEIDNSFSKPIIISGGAGNSNHLFQGLEHPKVNAVATANLFNFVGNGLPNARKLLLDQGCELARW